MGALYFLSSTKYSVIERQTKRGKVYDCRFRLTTPDGKSVNKCLSGYPSKTALKEAYTDFVTKNCELLKNNSEAVRRKKENATAADKSMKFSDLYAEYMLSLRNQIKDSTLYEKNKIYRLYLAPYFADKKVGELTKAVLQDWQEQIWTMKLPNGEYYSYKYLSDIRAYLSAFLSWVADKYEIPSQLEKVKKPKRRVAKTQMQYWTREEFDKFIGVVDNPTFHAMFTMMFFTGRRKGEVIALSNNDVQADRICFDKTYNRRTTDGSAYQISSTKNEKRGWTIIAEPLKAELACYTPQAPFYFGGENPIHENTLGHAFDRYIAKAGVKRIRVHDLRHSFVSMCIHLGASVYVVADLIGDTPEQVLKTYGHLYEEDKVKIISQIK